jgi:coenzyme PQQ precursor peptide PqqA
MVFLQNCRYATPVFCAKITFRRSGGLRPVHRAVLGMSESGVAAVRRICMMRARAVIFAGAFELEENKTMWTKPEYTEMRFGFEVTMYIANR